MNEVFRIKRDEPLSNSLALAAIIQLRRETGWTGALGENGTAEFEAPDAVTHDDIMSFRKRVVETGVFSAS